jgi:hypothetical protein
MEIRAEVPTIIVDKDRLIDDFVAVMGGDVALDSIGIMQQDGIYYLTGFATNETGNAKSIWIALESIGPNQFSFPTELRINICTGTQCAFCVWHEDRGCDCEKSTGPDSWSDHTLIVKTPSLKHFDWLLQ